MALATHDTWRFRVSDLWQMRRSGVLPEDARVELLDGEVVPMAPEGSAHGSVVADVHDALRDAVGRRARRWNQSALRLDEHTLVQPDVALLRPREDGYFHEIPTAADVLLAVEVSHSSLARDRVVKAPLYARAGVPELWLIRVEERAVEVLRQPEDGRYTWRRLVGISGDVEVAAIDGARIAVRSLFAAD